jgi:RND family efflux transporter MFP subunit
MTGNTRVSLDRTTAVVAGLALVIGGAGASYLLMRNGNDSSSHIVPGRTSPVQATAASQPSLPSHAPINSTLPDVVVPLSADAIQRAGIVVAPVSHGGSGGDLRLPGVVEPNAYRQVVVTPLVSGRLTRVSSALGDRVRRGQALAQIYSPELADAQTRYVSAKAMLDEHDRELQRTENLVEIGAASRQELERTHAEHAAQLAAVQSARAQLELLGVSSSAIDGASPGSNVNATVSVAAPIDGVVTERAANVGLNVDPATNLFTVVDLSNVWIVADLYEKDFARVRVGSTATVTTTAYPGMTLQGKVSYIDPQVNTESRTAKVRIEVPNARGELRLGMFVDVVVGTGEVADGLLMVPRSAVQNVADRTVVYIASDGSSGKFIEREVRLGHPAGDRVEVASGLTDRDTVVVEGSFFVRAESERLGLRARAQTEAPPGKRDPSVRERSTSDMQMAKIAVTEQGFEPSQLTVRAGTPVRLTFLRTTDKTCATEVVFPSLNIRRALPLNEPVQIDFTPPKAGELAFACGVNMFKGTVTVQ